MKRPLLESGREELASWCESKGERPFRAKQILEWVVRHRAVRFDQMTNLPKSLREQLDLEWRIFGSSIAKDSGDLDGTHKLLLALTDVQTIECVLLPEEERRTICISTQVGCGMACVFCASGLNGVERNLTTGEIIEEMLQLQNLLPATERISHIVVMGMGEPLANLDALLPALAFATSPEGLGISARHVTISTVGLPAKIRRLAEENRPYHLAVSLHAPNDEIRRRIVPTAEKVVLSEILAAADEFREKTGRQVTFEYVLLEGINDQPEHAKELARLLGRRDALINLIPYNPVSGLPYGTPPAEGTARFAEILRDSGFVVKIRKRKGSKISAACGQLRRTNGLVALQ
ncbi:MAG: 23S rRNA (adenine(2503)-C(2))-methyltransferase RlmN [Planctomycetota bacterium]